MAEIEDVGLEEVYADLEGMSLDCTRAMREDEVSAAEGRRITALGYLGAAGEGDATPPEGDATP